MDKYISYENIIGCFDEIGRGDVVYVVSDILALSIKARENKERMDLNRLIDSILNKVGSPITNALALLRCK